MRRLTTGGHQLLAADRGATIRRTDASDPSQDSVAMLEDPGLVVQLFLAAFAVGLYFGASFAFVVYVLPGTKHLVRASWTRAVPTRVLSVIQGVLVGIACFYVFFYTTSTINSLWTMLLAVLVSLAVAVFALRGCQLAWYLRDGLVLFVESVAKPLNSLSQLLIGFMTWYLVIIALFSTSYWIIDWFQADAFSGLEHITNLFGADGANLSSKGDLLFYSLTTITTIGLSDVKPVTGLAKVVTSFEILVGLGWIAVVFAIFITYGVKAAIAQTSGLGVESPRVGEVVVARSEFTPENSGEIPLGPNQTWGSRQRGLSAALRPLGSRLVRWLGV